MGSNFPDEEFTIEDIIREFGSGSNPVEPSRPNTPDKVPQTPKASTHRRVERRHTSHSHPAPTEKPSEELYADGYDALEGTVEDYTFSLKKGHVPQRRERLPQPKEKARTIEAISHDVRKQGKALAQRLRVCLVVSVVSLLLTLYHGFGLRWIPGFENVAAMGIISLLLLLCAMGVAYDVLRSGFQQLRTARLGAEALIAILCADGVIEAIASIIMGELPFCTLVSLELLCALWARQRKMDALQNVTYVLEHSPELSGIKRLEKAWSGSSAAARDSANREQFEAMLETDSLQECAMRVYAPISLGLSVGLAGIGAILGHVNFLRLWTALLLTAVPLSATLCYALPYSLLTKRLSRKKAVLCGWYGAKVLRGCEALFLRDAELFPRGCMKLSGVKTFDDYKSTQIVRYAAAILQAVRCDAASLLMEEDRILPKLQNLRCFDEDGYSAEINGNTVLLGTLDFMKKMGVHLVYGARVQQAWYLSINGELAGLIALHYEALPEVRQALLALSRGDAPTPVLTGSDVLVSPALLRDQFDLPLTHLVCPPLRERMACGKQMAKADDLQGALIAKPGLAVMSAVCMGARALVAAVRAMVVLSILSGTIGLLIVFLLGLSGSQVVSCMQMLAFMSIWAGASGLAALYVLKK